MNPTLRYMLYLLGRAALIVIVVVFVAYALAGCAGKEDKEAKWTQNMTDKYSRSLKHSIDDADCTKLQRIMEESLAANGMYKSMKGSGTGDVVAYIKQSLRDEDCV